MRWVELDDLWGPFQVSVYDSVIRVLNLSFPFPHMFLESRKEEFWVPIVVVVISRSGNPSPQCLSFPITRSRRVFSVLQAPRMPWRALQQSCTKARSKLAKSRAKLRKLPRYFKSIKKKPIWLKYSDNLRRSSFLPSFLFLLIHPY